MTVELDKWELRLIRKMMRRCELQCREDRHWEFSEKEAVRDLATIKHLRSKLVAR